MSTTSAPNPVDPDKLMSFVFKAVDDVGAALGCALTVMGDRLGLYRALVDHGPLTATELAGHTGCPAPYAHEWLAAQAAGGVLEYDAASDRFTLPPEQAMAMTDPSSPAYLPGFYQLAVGTIRDLERLLAAVPAGEGIGWDQHNSDVYDGCERFFRTTYSAHLVAEWLPALDGVVDKLQRGARVADMACGHAASTVLMARAFPASRFTGSDYHAPSVEVARGRVHEAGLDDRVAIEVAGSQGFSGSGYDLVTTFDALHDMGDPVAAARHVRSALAADGTWMVVEPMAGDHVEDNLHSRGRAFYGFSALLCTPASLAQPTGMALGTQAGPARIEAVVREAGFTRFRVAAQTPFNIVYEIRP